MDKKFIRESFLEAVDNQIKTNKPPETAETYKRLMNEGYSKSDAKKLIAQCIAAEFFVMVKYGKPHDEQRYIRNLKNLPEEISEE